MTPVAYAPLCAQLELLRTVGPGEMTERVAEARRDGGLTDNPAPAEALEEQAQLEARIAELEGLVERAHRPRDLRRDRPGDGARREEAA